MSTISMDPQVYRAAKLGKTTLLQHVVDEDSSRLLRVTPNKNTTLHVSVTFGHREFVKKVYFALLQHNSSLEGNTEYSKSLSLLTQVNSEGDTALHVAAREGHASIAKFLIEKIKPWPSDHDIESGSSSLLVPEKIRMRNESKNTALHEAVQRNDLEMVKLLTEVDPDLGHPNYDVDVDGHGESPLYLAAKDGHLDILNHIFLICPSPAHGGPYGRTALHVAVIEGRLDVVKILLEKKGEVLVNKADKDGRTALHYAVSNRYKNVLEQLLSNRYNALEIVQQLLRHDTSSAYKLDKDGLSPLHIAALESSIKVFRELIQWCPDSGELLDKKHRNVLHFAVMSKDFKKISFALRQVELEGLVNKTDDDGNTPCHLAATLGSFMLMRHFLSIRRVGVKATNNMGQTAAEIFQSTQEGNTASMLLYQLLMAHIFWPWHAINVRGENKWMIGGGGGANKEQISSDPLQNQAEGEKKAATTKVTKNQREMGKTLQIVASLIATVAFTAVFQVPGGYNSDPSSKAYGKPILIDNGDFKSFIRNDIAALSLSLISLMVMFLAPFAGDHFYSSFFKMGTFLICCAILFTIVAFFKGMTAVLSNFDVVLDQSNTVSAFTSLIVSLVYILFLADIVATLFLLRHSRIESSKNLSLLLLGILFLLYLSFFGFKYSPY
ncbi:ankyrin repeat-containing protein At5g02620-like [Macadamia integrifolia]|uniref:ankyrin repeat-containing protein At5g02620-like n=1 Tax=Macadamia integrifolia TaxID=60698 RepID=UPI001C4E54EA|nr:ankyrin repeat-containing protein At5g02620-like [Macadamia integrifolia]